MSGLTTPAAVTAYVALGGNVGDRPALLRTALQRLRAVLRVTQVSPIN